MPDVLPDAATSAASRCRRLLVPLLALLVAGCAYQIRTRHDMDPTVDLASYATYAWISDDPLIPPKSGEGEVSYVSPIDDQRIRRIVNAQLEGKGYRKAADREVADLIVSYGIGREEKVEIYGTPGSYGPRAYPRGYGYGGWYGGSTVEVSRYTEGTLTLELFDRKTKQALWIGWGSKRVTDSEDREAVIQTAVEKILAPLPSHSGAAAVAP